MSHALHVGITLLREYQAQQLYRRRRRWVPAGCREHDVCRARFACTETRNGIRTDTANGIANGIANGTANVERFTLGDFNNDISGSKQCGTDEIEERGCQGLAQDGNRTFRRCLPELRHASAVGGELSFVSWFLWFRLVSFASNHFIHNVESFAQTVSDQANQADQTNNCFARHTSVRADAS